MVEKYIRSESEKTRTKRGESTPSSSCKFVISSLSINATDTIKSPWSTRYDPRREIHHSISNKGSIQLRTLVCDCVLHLPPSTKPLPHNWMRGSTKRTEQIIKFKENKVYFPNHTNKRQNKPEAALVDSKECVEKIETGEAGSGRSGSLELLVAFAGCLTRSPSPWLDPSSRSHFSDCGKHGCDEDWGKG